MEKGMSSEFGHFWAKHILTVPFLLFHFQAPFRWLFVYGHEIGFAEIFLFFLHFDAFLFFFQIEVMGAWLFHSKLRSFFLIWFLGYEVERDNYFSLSFYLVFVLPRSFFFFPFCPKYLFPFFNPGVLVVYWLLFLLVGIWNLPRFCLLRIPFVSWFDAAPYAVFFGFFSLQGVGNYRRYRTLPCCTPRHTPLCLVSE